MNIEKLEKILIRIPSDLTINVFELVEVNASEFIENTITLINTTKTDDILKIGKKVCSEIAFKPDIMYDKVFDNWFKVWDRDPINAEHVRQVEKELRDMTIEYETLLKRFNKMMKEVEAAEERFQYYLKFANPQFGRILKLNPEKPNAKKVKDILVGLQPLLDKLLQQLHLVLKHLKRVRFVLIDYNKARVRWVEFLMAMRESLTSERRTSVHIERIIRFFANVICGNGDF